MLEPVFPILMPDGWIIALGAVFLAFVLDLIIGDPQWLYRRMPHPVVWMGSLISGLETILRNPQHGPARQFLSGAVLVVVALGVCTVASGLVAALAEASGYGWIIAGLVGSVFIAARGLHAHVAEVAHGLNRGLAEGRQAVSQIVGRDPEQLDEAGVSRAALESLAENFSDGVIAPLFWFLLAGLPGLVAYKMINTMDSMIGHRNERYLYFGRFAARLDDIVNWPASRITGLLFCVTALITKGAQALKAWQAIRRDAVKHTSPNAGWPEAALAGALGLALAGPRSYDARETEGAWMGDGRREATANDISRGLALYRTACGVIVAAFILGLAIS